MSIKVQNQIFCLVYFVYFECADSSSWIFFLPGHRYGEHHLIVLSTESLNFQDGILTVEAPLPGNAIENGQQSAE